jgi:hypothetical protein
MTVILVAVLVLITVVFFSTDHSLRADPNVEITNVDFSEYSSGLTSCFLSIELVGDEGYYVVYVKDPAGDNHNATIVHIAQIGSATTHVVMWNGTNPIGGNYTVLICDFNNHGKIYSQFVKYFAGINVTTESVSFLKDYNSGSMSGIILYAGVTLTNNGDLPTVIDSCTLSFRNQYTATATVFFLDPGDSSYMQIFFAHTFSYTPVGTHDIQLEFYSDGILRDTYHGSITLT